MLDGKTQASGLGRDSAKLAANTVSNFAHQATDIAKKFTEAKDDIVTSINEEKKIVMRSSKNLMRMISEYLGVAEKTIRKYPYTSAGIAMVVSAVCRSNPAQQQKTRVDAFIGGQ